MHTACIKKFFGTTTLPVLDYTTEQLDQLALQIIQDQNIFDWCSAEIILAFE